MVKIRNICCWGKGEELQSMLQTARVLWCPKSSKLCGKQRLAKVGAEIDLLITEVVIPARQEPGGQGQGSISTLEIVSFFSPHKGVLKSVRKNFVKVLIPPCGG